MLFLFPFFCQAQGTLDPKKNFCQDSIGKIPVLSNGRIKPLFVVAKESVAFLFESKPQNKTDVEIFCLLSLESLGIFQNLNLKIKIDHPELRTILGLPENEKGMNILSLEEQSMKLRSEMVKRKLNDSLKKEMTKVLIRMQEYRAITQGLSWTIPHFENKELTWLPLPQGLNEEKIKLLSSNIQKNPITHFLLNQATLYEAQKGKNHLLEYYYFKLRPYSWCLIIGILGILSLYLFPSPKIGMILLTSIILIQILAIISRVTISGRAPITNMYETVLFSGFGALIFATIFYVIKKQKIYLLAGLSYNVLCLLMMTFANNMLSPSINPLVPVLRDNFWLSTHVTSVILSYAALALSWMLANLVLLQEITGKKIFDHYQYNATTPLIYNAIKVGVVMLTGGVILGGVWADYSWGRFWGWDPKETWSLIVILIYAAILHGKQTSWINPKRFVPITALAFLSVIMAWFGVNYILASGLHSYGFSEGGAIFIGSFFLAQITLVIIYLIGARVNKKLSPNS